MITGQRTDHVFRRYTKPTPETLKAVVAGDVYRASAVSLERKQQTR
jgi:hypothetical protein